MTKNRMLSVLIAATLLFTGSASAALTGYLKIPDIDGESLRTGDNNQTQTVGGSQTRTVGAYQSETIKGGQAVVIGALWNGSENPPRSNSGGSVKLTLQRGALSGSLLRLKTEKRVIPSLKLVVDGKAGPETYVLYNAVVRSYASSGSGASAYEEIELVFEVMDWEDVPG